MSSRKNTFDHLWFPFTCSQDIEKFPPRVIERGQGVYLYDAKGERYLDAIGSWWVSNLGHGHPRITAAVKKQLDKLEHVLMAGFIAKPALELSRLLAPMLPKGLTRIFYSDDGSTAVEVALKIALQYWAAQGKRRALFVSLAGGYHGDTLGAMSVGDIPAYHSLFHGRFKSQLYTDAPYCYRCPCGKMKETCAAECMTSLEKILAAKGESVAACVFEPMVQGAAGMRIYPAKVLKRIAASCKKYGVLTIADEVFTGFGRTGKLFACEHAGIIPDVMCLAKGLTGGYLPMAATVTNEKIYAAFCGDFRSGRELAHGHSFTGNPLAAAAACEALSIIKEEKIPQSLVSKAAFFRKKLELFDEIEEVGDIRSIGMIAALELVADRKTKKPLPVGKRIPFRIAQKALDKGLLIRPLGNVLYFVPAYIITEDEIEFMMSVTQKSIKEILGEELEK
ncbi:MAG TPA: adenosylmethionine--8-amino-7-oxononanoate transaminase [Chitinivibrionales bacterium]|nr:adenosylmethionine--8-amino-7-oxononanoate transaminase [Chitinivibrionales bacterium]